MHDRFTYWLFMSFWVAWVLILLYLGGVNLERRYGSWKKNRALRAQKRKP